MFLKVIEPKSSISSEGKGLSSLSSTPKKEIDHNSSHELSLKSGMFKSEKKDVSEELNSNHDNELSKISLKQMREEIFENEDLRKDNGGQPEELNQNFKFEKLQESSRNFLFNNSLESPWEKVETRSLSAEKNILVIGDISNESSVLNDELNGESFNLLGKMFGALKLSETKVRFCSFIEEGVQTYLGSKNLFDFIKQTNTTRIMTLGAAPLGFFEIKGRLTKVHGKKIDIFFEEKKVEVLPIFHPEYLLINPNMKKRVWDDIKFLMNS